MDKCSEEQKFLNKKRVKSEDLEQLINNNNIDSKILELNKIDNQNKINESKIETDMNNYNKMRQILKNIESRNKSAESCIICYKEECIYPISSIQEYVYLCKYLYSTEEVKESSNYTQSLTNFSITFSEHQRENFKDVIFKFIKSICKICLIEHLKSPKGFNIVYYMLINKNFKPDFAKKDKEGIDNIIEILNSVKTPSAPDVNNLFNIPEEDLEKTLEEIKKNFFNQQYDNLLQKLFLSYIFSNLETFLGQLMKTQLLCDKMTENIKCENINEQLFLLKNMYSYGGNLIKELSSNINQLKANANKIFRDEISDINESINSNNINIDVNYISRNMNEAEIMNPVDNFINYLSPELNTQLLFNQLARNYNQILGVNYI
jgi:hypothetical protein